MRLSGIEISNFRSIGSTPVLLHSLRKCNLLVGQNNVGKSNVLKAVQQICYILRSRYGTAISSVEQDNQPSLSHSDLHRENQANRFTFKLIFEAEPDEDTSLIEHAGTNKFDFAFDFQIEQNTIHFTGNSLAEIENIEQARLTFQDLTGLDISGRNVTMGFIREQYSQQHERVFRPFARCIPAVLFIPEFRKISNQEQYKVNGDGLPNHLANLENPQRIEAVNRLKFDRINRFLQNLLQIKEFRLDIDRKDNILVYPGANQNDSTRPFPLDAYGTGVHELVIFLTAVLSFESVLFCIEEPEIHLHPRLQRHFIEFLTTDTSNQYLISTHSPTIRAS